MQIVQQVHQSTIRKKVLLSYSVNIEFFGKSVDIKLTLMIIGIINPSKTAAPHHSINLVILKSYFIRFTQFKQLSVPFINE